MAVRTLKNAENRKQTARFEIEGIVQGGRLTRLAKQGKNARRGVQFAIIAKKQLATGVIRYRFDLKGATRRPLRNLRCGSPKPRNF